MKRFIASGIAAGVLALTVAAGGYASSVSAATPNAPAAQATTTATPAKPKGQQRGTAPQRGAAVARFADHGLLGILADLTKLSRQEIMQELRAGKSIATIASEHGSSADAVIAAARSKLQTRLQQAVTDGKLTQEKADAALKRFDEQAPTVVNKTDWGKTGPGRAGKGHGVGQRAMVEATASVTGLTVEQVQAELKSGKTFAQIAQEHGKTTDDILAKMRELAQQKVDKGLEKAKDKLNSSAQEL